MKIKNFLAMMLMALCVAACSSDDDGPSPAQTVADNYTGYTIADCDYFTGTLAQNETITITANEDGTATVSYTSSTWGTSTITAATITTSTNGYTISGTGTSVIAGHSGTNTYDCEFTGTISADKSEVEMVLTLPDVMNGTTITFYKGDAPDNLVVAGTYTGYTIADCYYFTGTLAQDETIAITANEDGTATVSYTSSTWGTSTITAATVTTGTNGYTISGTGTSVIAGHSGTNTYDCEFTGTISADKSEVEMVLTLPDVMNGTTITFYKGDAPASLFIAGNYSGYSDMDSSFFQDIITDGVTITIAANEDGTVNITFNELVNEEGTTVFVENTLSNIAIEVNSEGVYTLSGEGIFALGMGGGTPSNYDCTLTGTISSDKSEVEIIFGGFTFMGGTTITFRNGSAPTTE